MSLIRDGFSSSVRRATQQCREYFEVAQQSCRRKDARSSGVNFPDSALAVGLGPNRVPRSKFQVPRCLGVGKLSDEEGPAWNVKRGPWNLICDALHEQELFVQQFRGRSRF